MGRVSWLGLPSEAFLSVLKASLDKDKVATPSASLPWKADRDEVED